MFFVIWTMQRIGVIGSGFAGLAAAAVLAKAGREVHVYEKNEMPGGRARVFHAAGFTFDMGPSWYWMPEVFERYFNCFGKKTSDYYELVRLDPSYRVYWQDGFTNIPAAYNELRDAFEQIEKGSAAKLDAFLEEAAYKYEVGIHKLVHKPGLSFKEFLSWELAKGVFKLDVFTSMKKHISRFFKNSKLQQLMEFPVLFLGALPQDTPALYSLMNYADIKLGTWYPRKGMYEVVDGMYRLAKELGVKFVFGSNVTAINTSGNRTTGVVVNGAETFAADAVIASADYHHVETSLLPASLRSYTTEYWNKRVMAPSCLLYYIGLNRKLEGLTHHCLFFDADFEVHGREIYTTRKWPVDPLFYVSVSSITDPTVAPEGCENLVLLVPVASGLEADTETLRDKYLDMILTRFEQKTGQQVKDSIIYKKSYSVSNFAEDYNSFRGNAYGLANTLMQTAIFKPSCRSIKIKNLFYTGQLTVPGPGVPPSLISGEVVAGEVLKDFAVL